MRSILAAVVLTLGVAVARADHPVPPKPALSRIPVGRRSHILATREVLTRFARAQADLRTIYSEASQDLGAQVVDVQLAPDGESGEWVVQDAPAKAQKGKP